jgi:hypothetical protein
MSSKINSNADVLSLIDKLNNEEVRIIHRALNNKCQVDWEKEFKLNTSNRKKKTRKVLDFLTVVFAMKMAKSEQKTLDCFQSFYAEESSELDPIKLQYKQFMKNRWEERQAKLESRDATLKGLLRNSKQDDLETFEYLIIKPEVTFDGFLILDDGITSHPSKIEPSVVDIFTSASSACSSSSSSAASSSGPPMSMSSTPLADVSDEAEELLSMLDEKSARIALQARLNNYQIPFAKFSFSVSEEVEKCMNVVNYLNSILERKTRSVLEKNNKSSPVSPEHQFYCEKLSKYEEIRNAMWTSYMTNKASPPPFHPASSSSRSKSSRGRKARK